MEKIESMDMMRIIKNVDKIKLINTKYNTYSVDILKDLKKIKRLING